MQRNDIYDKGERAHAEGLGPHGDEAAEVMRKK
jgi:hypothetical protein